MVFDDALMRIGIGRGQYFSIATMCLLWMGEGMQMFICFYLPKAFYEELEVIYNSFPEEEEQQQFLKLLLPLLGKSVTA